MAPWMDADWSLLSTPLPMDYGQIMSSHQAKTLRAQLIEAGHTGEVGGSTLGGLEDNGALAVARGLEGWRGWSVSELIVSGRVRGGWLTGNDGRAGSYVDGGDGEAQLLGVLEQLVDIIAVDDTGLAGEVLGGHGGIGCGLLGVGM